MTQLELLAPARNLECGMAAIDHGADAVYIGASRFGARAAAGNSIDDIRRLCDYAHPFGARVYVTVNTILYDDELEATRELLQQLSEARVDAILVQDMGVIVMSYELSDMSHNSEFITHNSLSFHASTQTDNRSPEKVRWLHQLGFSRVVLARELSVSEIAEIHRQVPDVELEVFVHGALCVSYSGQCYASQYCFGRSANRGECAQFCRMRFSLEDAEGRVVERDRHLLSLRDLNRSDHLEELIEAGATSFKIEGRLKDVGYVKNVTAAYSERLNAIIHRHPDRYCRSSLGRCSYTFRPDLRRTFNRGYTDYFLHGRKPGIASFDTPKAMGEPVGTVKELRGDSFNVAGTATFANGDGLCFLDDQRQLVGFRANRVAGNRIWPYRMPQGLRPGLRLYRNSDQVMDRALSRPSAERKIPVRLSLRAVDGGFELSAGDVSTFLAAEHQQAKKPPRENIIRQLSKLGDTIYECEGVDIPADFNYFIPNSVLTELRRTLVERMILEERGKRKVKREMTQGQSLSSFHFPLSTSLNKPSTPYLLNISNRLSASFYGVDSPSAFELKGGVGPLMQCRYCLRYELGYCVRHGGQRPQWREPLSLVLGDGRRFRLEFDCTNCQMNVYAQDR